MYLNEGEDLEEDQVVTLVLRCYPTNQNNGIALDAVICEGQMVRKNFLNAASSALAAMGNTWIPAAKPSNAAKDFNETSVSPAPQMPTMPQMPVAPNVAPAPQAVSPATLFPMLNQ